MSKLSSSLLACCLAGLSLTSHAQSTPDARAAIDWSSFSLQLFDLNTLDGVTPHFRWTSQTSSAFVQDATLGSVSDGSPDWSTQAIALSGAQRGVAGTSLIEASVSTRQTFEATSIATRSGYFVLSANTVAVFNAASSLSVVSDSQSETSAFAQAYLSSYAIDSNGKIATQRSFSEFVAADDGSRPPIAGGTLAVSFTNATALEANGVFEANVHVFGSNASPVPEPHAIGLLLSGLALTTGLARRRRAC